MAIDVQFKLYRHSNCFYNAGPVNDEAHSEQRSPDLFLPSDYLKQPGHTMENISQTHKAKSPTSIKLSKTVFVQSFSVKPLDESLFFGCLENNT